MEVSYQFASLEVQHGMEINFGFIAMGILSRISPTKVGTNMGMRSFIWKMAGYPLRDFSKVTCR